MIKVDVVDCFFIQNLYYGFKEVCNKMTDTKFHPWADCATCKHCINQDDKCLAFPEKIPIEIYGNWIKHRDVRKDQEGEWIYETTRWAIESGIKLDRPVRKH